MTAVKNNKENKTQTGYQVYCFLILFFRAVYRGLKKAVRGKCSHKAQTMLTILAFAFLGSLLLLPAVMEWMALSFVQTILIASGLLAGFALCCDLAGAFRPYQYLKKQGRRSVSNQVLQLPEVNHTVKRSA